MRPRTRESGGGLAQRFEAVSSKSTISFNLSNGCAPTRGRPLTKKSGVELTPRLSPSFRLASTAAEVRPVSRQAPKDAASSPSPAA